MSKLGLKLLVAAIALAAGATPGSAQGPVAVQEDPLFAALFQPELIMQHQRAIALTDAQRDAISGMIQELQGRVVRLQWELLDEMQRLTEILSGPRVDLDRALDQLDNLFDTENEIKQAHLEMLVRIKNRLSAEQQATLAQLRDAGGA